MIVKQIIEFGCGCALTKRARTSGRKFTTFDHRGTHCANMLQAIFTMGGWGIIEVNEVIAELRYFLC